MKQSGKDRGAEGKAHVGVYEEPPTPSGWKEALCLPSSRWQNERGSCSGSAFNQTQRQCVIQILLPLRPGFKLTTRRQLIDERALLLAAVHKANRRRKTKRNVRSIFIGGRLFFPPQLILLSSSLPLKAYVPVSLLFGYGSVVEILHGTLSGPQSGRTGSSAVWAHYRALRGVGRQQLI